MAARWFIFLILGLMLLIAGFAMQNIEAGFGPWSVISYAIGIIFIVIYLIKNKDDLLLLLRRRSARHGVISLVFILAFLGILVMAGLFSERHNYRWDLTKNKTHSIALQSRQQLERLDKDTLDLYAYTFYRGDADLRSKQQLVDLFKTYGYYSKRFKHELVDIDRNPLLAMQLGITSTSTIILRYGEREEKIYSEQEAKITNAIASLLRGGSKPSAGAVYFVTGHGEPALDLSEAFNYGRAKDVISESIGPVRELLLATGKPVPDSCEILVVAGPEKDFLNAELESISDFIRAGGRVLFLLEPFMAENLIPFLGGYGVKLGDDLVIDLLRGAAGSPFAFLVDSYPTHDITRYFDIGTVFDMTRSVRADSSLPPGISVEEFIKTSEKSYAESDRELLQTRFDLVAQKAMDEGQAVPIGVAVTLKEEFLRKLEGHSAKTQSDTTGEKAAEPVEPSDSLAPQEARMVVIGDRDFITNAYLTQLGNSDLLLNCLRWLQGQSDEITIAPKETENTPLMLERSDLVTMGLTTVVALPVGIIFIGLFVWVRRRSKR
ncbi:MAG TPA: Gldg family protein [archaeon]|nr:Gldg family protein [archaeon]